MASIADLSNYIRLLFAIKGKAYCPYCNEEIKMYSSSQLTEYILNNENDKIISFYTPVFKNYDETYDDLLTNINNLGFQELIIDNKEYNGIEKINSNIEHKIEVFISKVRINKDNYEKIINLIEKSLMIGENYLIIKSESNDNKYTTCVHHTLSGIFYHKNFSPNDPTGACPTCEGLGRYKVTDPELLIKDENKTLRENPLYVSQFALNDNNGKARLYSLANHYHFSIDVPFRELSNGVKKILFYGTNKEKYEILKPDGNHEANPRYTTYGGLCKYVTRMHKTNAFLPNNTDDNLFKTIVCPDCNGSGIKKIRTYVKILGKSICEVNEMSIKDLTSFINLYALDKDSTSSQIIEEILAKLNILNNIGLGYLSLDRRTDTLSGGEYQRIRIASQIGSDLKGITYIIDEPTTGLHAKDTHKIIEILKRLRDAGNTVLVVEHDLDVIKEADYIVEMGPGAGSNGGEVIAKGSISELIVNDNSILGKYISGITKIDVPSKRRIGNGKFVKIYNASENNLKNINVSIPLGKFVCITGVSGSGKSTFMNQIFYKAISKKLLDKRVIPGKYDFIEGIENIKGIRYIDQLAIGKSTRSNPCTYLGIYTQIRQLFAQTDMAKEKNYDAGYFSFNNKGGRCENCFGEGTIVIELKFMQDMTSVCPVCNGKRFSNDLLKVKYNGLNISEVLNLTVSEGIEFFKDEQSIFRYLKIMDKLGLGYIKLGQSTASLSGGESQRLKLAKELGKQNVEKNIIYVLDEPTSGLHEKDIEKFLTCINEIVDYNNTVVVIEHNLDVIKTADYVIDFGPEAGNKGGNIVVEGTPEEICKNENSYTGKYLKPLLQ